MRFILLGSVTSIMGFTAKPNINMLHTKATTTAAGTAHYLHDRKQIHPNHRVHHSRRSSSSLYSLHLLRGGATEAATAVASSASTNKVISLLSPNKVLSSPASLFNALLSTLLLSKVGILVWNKIADGSSGAAPQTKKPAEVRALQLRFLPVFYLLRCADWLQGPYFYEVYASKTFGGIPATIQLISYLFLTGFASTALFGPFVGRYSDVKGRKRGTLLYTVLYALGAMSTKSALLGMLLLGRVMSGIGTSLLFSAPEAWLVGEAQKTGAEAYLGETFGLAYAGDSIVAILAGQLAGLAASNRGPTGPFELSTMFLFLGAILAAFSWKENVAGGNEDENGEKATIRDAFQMIQSDSKIALVGAVQSLFEAAMYIFVLQWPPAMSKAIGGMFGSSAATPYGKIFSCFMACCLLGSTLFGQLSGNTNISTETSTAGMLSVATLSMGTSVAVMTSSALQSTIVSPLVALIASFFFFEACVGMYFPSIGTLRSKYIPDSHRSVIMNLFGIPLNVLVVSVFLSINKLGVNGALGVATGALGVAAACMIRLRGISKQGQLATA